ncbi:MAG: transthyretin-like family protein [Weeksellaceae bacterium]|nr:hypothetical protein [Bacteroidota bacterium]MCG2779496.1 transthyretin-like family protein [Weeksellaceae bacterium]
MTNRFILSTILPITFLMSPNGCQPEYVSNSRIFAEGKISSSAAANIPVKLYAEDILISETRTDAQGNFKLGGPGTTQEKSLVLNRKIISFNSSDPECKLAYDSLSIIIPAKNIAFRFPQIQLEQ